MKTVEIKNRKAKFDYEWLETFTAGMKLQGNEVKSIRMGKAYIAEDYCYFADEELSVKTLTITE